MKKACTVITAFFGKRRAYPHNEEEALSYWRDRLLPHLLDVDAGVDADIIIINHEADPVSKKAESFLFECVDGRETKNGVIKVLTRACENGLGLGFKSRDLAFKEYQDDYEYWFFSEEDTTAWIDNYLKKSIEYLEAHPEVAFVCCQYNQVARFSDRPTHCHGGIGCTKSEYLKEVLEKHGSLPYPRAQYDKSPSQKYYSICEDEGEIAFTNIYLEMGYYLGYMRPSVQNPLLMSTYAHALFRKNCRKVNWPCWKLGPQLSVLGQSSLEWEERFPHDYDIVHPKKGFIRFGD